MSLLIYAFKNNIHANDYIGRSNHLMSKATEKNKVSRPTIFDRLPEEGKKKVINFQQACRVFFKNQTDAGAALKVTQGTINRYTGGKLLVPLEVARRFEKFTNGAIAEDSIFFDYNEWIYDQKLINKRAKNNVSEGELVKKLPQEHKHEIT